MARRDPVTRVSHLLTARTFPGALAVAAGLAATVGVAAAQADPGLPALLERAGVSGAVAASCRGDFRPGHAGEVAAAVSDNGAGGRYLVIQDDGLTFELATYSGTPELTCYSVREADRLNAEIARSDTMQGQVVAEWDGTAVCGFIEATIAVCWQFAPERKQFVRIGGWTT